MTRRKRPTDEVRREAEERLDATRATATPPPPPPPRDPDATTRLLHELEVHQVELEMQNEELRAPERVEAGLARYTELFEFAPIGYAMLTPAAD